jgi:hypothetical protein
MNTPTIRPETIVRIEVISLLNALEIGDYAAAAKSQAELRSLGWYFGREAPRPQRRTASSRKQQETAL